MDFGYIFPLVHLVPTVAVLAAAFLVVRAVSVKVKWRRSDVHNLEDTLA